MEMTLIDLDDKIWVTSKAAMLLQICTRKDLFLLLKLKRIRTTLSFPLKTL